MEELKRYEVQTPVGVGIVWGIAPGKVLIDVGYSFLVEFGREEIEPIEREESR